MQFSWIEDVQCAAEAEHDDEEDDDENCAEKFFEDVREAVDRLAAVVDEHGELERLEPAPAVNVAARMFRWF